MVNLWHELDPGSDVPTVVNAVVESPMGTRNKYEYEKDIPGIILDRVLHSSVHYPGDYAFLPQSYYEDDDPFDILVLVENPTFPGCIIEVRPIALLNMVDDDGPDNKVIAVPDEDPRFDHVTNIADLSQPRLDEIEEFFETYKNLEENKDVKTDGYEGRQAAYDDIEHALELYQKKC